MYKICNLENKHYCATTDFFPFKRLALFINLKSAFFVLRGKNIISIYSGEIMQRQDLQNLAPE